MMDTQNAHLSLLSIHILEFLKPAIHCLLGNSRFLLDLRLRFPAEIQREDLDAVVILPALVRLRRIQGTA
ncbi:MAG: hypothetical protein GX493_06195 [Firmicutes bacterium]|nr:hypothetical protein [Bacillota bacterium]